MGALQTDEIFDQRFRILALPESQLHVVLSEGTEKLCLVCTPSFGSLRSRSKTQKTKAQSLSPLYFGSFCTNLTTQET